MFHGVPCDSIPQSNYFNPNLSIFKRFPSASQSSGYLIELEKNKSSENSSNEKCTFESTAQSTINTHNHPSEYFVKQESRL